MKKIIFLMLAAALFIGCKSSESRQGAEQFGNEPPCEHEYSQADIDRELNRLAMITDRADYTDDASFANFREVNTKGIRPGILYRSSHPAVPGARADIAARQADRARVFTIVNILDTRREITLYAANVPWYNTYINRDAITALFAGKEFFEPNFAGKLGEGLRFMIHRRGPYLIHCDYGTDATGFVVALLEALMGASPDEIIADYMQSYVNYYGFSEDEERYKIISQIPHEYLCKMNEGRVVNAANVSHAAELYLQNVVHLSPATITELKQMLASR